MGLDLGLLSLTLRAQLAHLVARPGGQIGHDMGRTGQHLTRFGIHRADVELDVMHPGIGQFLFGLEAQRVKAGDLDLLAQDGFLLKRKIGRGSYYINTALTKILMGSREDRNG